MSINTQNNTNMVVWEAVSQTDPDRTKSFRRAGGFAGTAINAVYLARKATEVFGPCGLGWGTEIVDEKYIPGKPLFAKDVKVGEEIIHVLRVKLWYVLDGKRGEITQYGQTCFVGINSNGFFTDEEAPKKSLTDATTKCLSLLGFAADVHMGLFDDVKYVNDARAKFAEQKAEAKQSEESQQRDEAIRLVKAVQQLLLARSKPDDHARLMSSLSKPAETTLAQLSIPELKRAEAMILASNKKAAQSAAQVIDRAAAPATSPA